MSAIASIGVTIPTPLSSVASSLDIAAAISSNLSEPSIPDNGECRLLGPFAIFVQGALGLLAMMSLVYKRYRERPQRPLKIWFFDASKQVWGSVLVHIANLLMSMLSSGQFSIKVSPVSVEARAVAELVGRMVDATGKYQPNPCSFYLLNLAIDTTVGIPILIFLLRIFTALFLLTPFGSPPESITSGNYGTPPNTWWWLKQVIIYFMGLMGMKFCVLIIFLVAPWISRVGDWALRWTEGNEALQVVFVMLVFPVIMNATQYYIIDSFIKKQATEHELIPDDNEEENRSYDESARGSLDDLHSEEEEDDQEVWAKGKVGRPISANERRGGGSGNQTPPKAANTDYDPQFDGDNSPTVIGSADSVNTERTRSSSVGLRNPVK
ncbi:hypothetical protein OIDMADRAFT_191760 [Oidiodendron maius Zn]|uniref:Vacuolar membrane protein n=1 Tax=Oidiodendron maius (strain Zn) TaxID=913774 RepID=A0A0C3DRE3_OIDMZ|nr:hypothetical protein OIDMADRAFT_191760 [Oidiodendron maius Zn]